MDVQMKYEDDSVVNTLNANTQVWLMKVPQFVYEHICEKSEGSVIGKIVMTKEVGTDEAKVLFFVDVPSIYTHTLIFDLRSQPAVWIM